MNSRSEVCKSPAGGPDGVEMLDIKMAEPTYDWKTCGLFSWGIRVCEDGFYCRRQRESTLKYFHSRYPKHLEISRDIHIIDSPYISHVFFNVAIYG